MENLKIVFISDIHLSPGQDWSDCIWKFTPNEEIPGLIERFVSIVNDELRPDLIIELGDRIIDVDTNTDCKNTATIYEEIDSKVNCPVFHVDGNHDFVHVGKPELALLLRNPELPYVRIYNGYKCIFFDSLDPMIDGVGGAVSEKQLAWLRHEMNCDDLPKMVFSHHPLNYHEIHRNFLIPSDTVPLMKVANCDEVRNILEGGRNFLFHGSGHLHWWSFRVTPNGTYLVNPPLSAAHPEQTNAPGWFMEADIWPEGKVDVKIHSIAPRRVVGNFVNC
ncbi:MAG: metallophosphoesterase [Sphaerochaetaceae bacterium]|nr:metallophosphoesterase [uncultured Sphaerochaeta sp.]MDC7228745.1 metallophosphoesterase [Sphaerochaetaceae bacterium]